MESIKNNGPMSSVKGAKISGGKVNTWAEVAGLGVTDTTVTTTERIHTSGPSDRSATGVNNTRVLKKQNGMDSSIEDLEVPKELNETDTEVPHTATPSKEDLVLDEITDKKRWTHYKRSLRYIRSLDNRDPSTLTSKEKNWKRMHIRNIAKYESLNKTVVEVTPSLNQRKLDAKPSKRGIVASSLKENCQFGKDRTTITSKGRTGKPGIKRQRSSDVRVPDGKRLKQSKSLTSAPELQVAIIDRNHPLGKIPTDKWLLVEEKILLALVVKLERSEDKSFAAFDGAKWMKGVKIIGCGNEKSLAFLKNCIGDIGELWPNAKIEVVSLDQVPFREIVRVWVPPPILDDQSILKLIKGQNKELGAENWTIVRGRARDKSEGKDLWIRIDPKSLQLLRPSQGVIKYGLNQLRLILPPDKNSNESKQPEGGTD